MELQYKCQQLLWPLSIYQQLSQQQSFILLYRRSNFYFLLKYYHKEILFHQQYIANGHGGAIYAEYSNVTLESSEFSNNYASSSGGAIYIYHYNLDYGIYIHQFQMNNTVVYSNRGYQGGAIYIIYNYKRNGNSIFQLEIYNLTASSNSASSHGGAMYI